MRRLLPPSITQNAHINCRRLFLSMNGELLVDGLLSVFRGELFAQNPDIWLHVGSGG
jgi:hypothetical protein